MIATVCLTAVCLALVAFIAWRERGGRAESAEHRAQVADLVKGHAADSAERAKAHAAQLSEFADRIQAPEARQVAAMEAALMPRPAPAIPEMVLAPIDEDFRIDALLNVES